MKNLKDLKPNEAIRVSKAEWPKLAELLDKDPGIAYKLLPHLKPDLLKATKWNPFNEYTIQGDIVIYATGGWDRQEAMNYRDRAIIPASEFLQPEPRFKVGDIVLYNGNKATITKVTWEEGYDKDDDGWWAYWFGAKGVGGAHLQPAPQYEIGEEYEFSFSDTIYVKGKLVTIIDHEFKYVVKVDNDPSPLCFKHIRPIQPVKIERWVNMYPDGEIAQAAYTSEKVAKSKAENKNCKQIKLTGTC